MGNAFQHQEVESREEHLLGKKQQYLAGFKTSAKAQLPIPFTVPDDEKTDLMHVISPYSVTHLFKTGRLHLDSNCEVLLDLECSSPDFITTRVSLVKTTGEGREILEFSGNTCCLSLGKAFDIISRNIKVHAVMDKEDPVPASEVRLRIKLHCNSSVTEHTFTHNVEQPGEVVAFTFVAGF